MNKLISGIIIAVFTISSAAAQVSVNGTFDAGFSSGGTNSSFISNGIHSEYKYLHFSIPQVNLLLFAPIDETFFVEARLQSDTWEDGTLGMPRFTLANVTWADPNRSHSISVGRFLTPFGFYSTRNLTIDRTFVELPLSYSYYVSISDEYGYWDNARYLSNYSSDEGLMTSVYFGLYATGLRWDWEIKENELNLQTAYTTVSLGSSRNYSNLANSAVTSRLVYNPNIEWQIGLNASYGSFMQLSPSDNGSLRYDNALEQYRQTLVGTDIRFGLGFWEVIGEVIYSSWHVPAYLENQSGFVFEPGSNKLRNYDLSNIGMNIDVRFEPPFLTGSYFALRFDHLNFIEKSPFNQNQYGTIDWDKDKYRVSGALGYKLSRNVEVKILASEQTPFDSSLFTFRALLTAFF